MHRLTAELVCMRLRARVCVLALQKAQITRDEAMSRSVWPGYRWPGSALPARQCSSSWWLALAVVKCGCRSSQVDLGGRRCRRMTATGWALDITRYKISGPERGYRKQQHPPLVQLVGTRGAVEKRGKKATHLPAF
jgi:hypothetical protein